MCERKVGALAPLITAKHYVQLNLKVGKQKNHRKLVNFLHFIYIIYM